MKKTELLLPAGSLERLKTAILYGADAVYLGTPDMSLRTKSKFSLEDVLEGIQYAHQYNKKVYLTLNLFSHNKDIEKLSEILKTIETVNPDGLIVADPGIFNIVRKNFPNLELHISTQANISSWLSVNFWKEQGAKLVVLAREVTFEELTEIREKCPDIKLETFIHGSMCMTYSGRCLLSNFMSERGANQGSCAHSCRWKYKLKIKLKDNTEHEIEINDQNKDLFDFFLEEEVRPGELMPFEEDFNGSYILNSKDLCLMPKLDEYLKLGLDSLKVEGRNKTEYYAGTIARAYRTAIDDYYKDPENWKFDGYMNELNKVANRGYSLAFHEGRLKNLAHDYYSSKSSSLYEYAGRIIRWEDDNMIVEVKNRLVKGDVLEFLIPGKLDVILLRIYEFIDSYTKETKTVAHPGQKNQIAIPLKLFHLENKNNLKKILPSLTLIRKEKILEESEILRLKIHKQSQKIEDKDMNNSYGKYDRLKEEYLSSLDANNKNIAGSKRIGPNGCCGKGCNGCLVFWYDEKYKKAREIIKSKKIGELL